MVYPSVTTLTLHLSPFPYAFLSLLSGFEHVETLTLHHVYALRYEDRMGKLSAALAPNTRTLVLPDFASDSLDGWSPGLMAALVATPAMSKLERIDFPTIENVKDLVSWWSEGDEGARLLEECERRGVLLWDRGQL